MTEILKTSMDAEGVVHITSTMDEDTKSVASILKERGNQNGDYTNTARYIQSIKRVIWSSPNWRAMSDDQRETMEMLAHKMGRVLSGDPNHADHWLDIAGYATLTAERVGQAQS